MDSHYTDYTKANLLDYYILIGHMVVLELLVTLMEVLELLRLTMTLAVIAKLSTQVVRLKETIKYTLHLHYSYSLTSSRSIVMKM